MMNDLERLQSFFGRKAIAIDELSEHYHEQNDIEFSIALLKLDFQLDDLFEIDFLIFEVELEKLYEALKQHDSKIVRLTYEIENLGQRMLQLS
jgi:hypothetical protein